MKRVIGILLVALLLFGQILTYSACGFGKAQVEYSNDGKTLVKYHGGGDSTVFKIPKKVTKIGRGAFADCGELTEIIIPSSVETIDVQAFAGCTGLTRITVPDSVTTIADAAFMGCSELVSISLGSGVTNIGQAAFNGCTKLVEVLNHSSLDLSEGSSAYGEIGYYAKAVHGSESLVTERDGYLFYSCGEDRILLGYNGEDTDLSLPESIDGGSYKIHDYAFFDRDTLTSVTIPDSVTAIGERAFMECSSLAHVSVGNSVTKVGDSAFFGCKKLTEITLPEGVNSIGDSAFKNCSSLVSAKLPAGLESIGDSSFYCCSSLTEIIIPEGVTYLGSSAFEGCYSLAKATVPRGITAIYSYTFYGCSSLTSFTVPEGVTVMGSSAFYGCYRLVEITFPETLERIDNYAFGSCYSLMSVTSPESMKCIDEYAFGFLTNEKLVEVINYSDVPLDNEYYIYNFAKYTKEIHQGESKLDVVGDYIFYSHDGVNYLMGYTGAEKNITLPDGYRGEVYTIHSYAFAYNDAIESVVIPNSVTYMGEHVFEMCKSLKRVDIGDMVKNIGDYAFYGSDLREISIGLFVESIGFEIFVGCTELVNITVDERNACYKSVDGSLYSKNGNKLIQYAVGREDYSFSIPDGVSTVCEYAFYGCDSLVRLEVPRSGPNFGNYAFDGLY